MRRLDTARSKLKQENIARQSAKWNDSSQTRKDLPETIRRLIQLLQRFKHSFGLTSEKSQLDSLQQSTVTNGSPSPTRELEKGSRKSFGYNHADQITTVTNNFIPPDTFVGGVPFNYYEVTTTTYDNQGRVATVSHPDWTSTSNEYYEKKNAFFRGLFGLKKEGRIARVVTTTAKIGSKVVKVLELAFVPIDFKDGSTFSREVYQSSATIQIVSGLTQVVLPLGPADATATWDMSQREVAEGNEGWGPLFETFLNPTSPRWLPFQIGRGFINGVQGQE